MPFLFIPVFYLFYPHILGNNLGSTYPGLSADILLQRLQKQQQQPATKMIKAGLVLISLW